MHEQLLWVLDGCLFGTFLQWAAANTPVTGSQHAGKNQGGPRQRFPLTCVYDGLNYSGQESTASMKVHQHGQ